LFEGLQSINQYENIVELLMELPLGEKKHAAGQSLRRDIRSRL